MCVLPFNDWEGAGFLSGEKFWPVSAVDVKLRGAAILFRLTHSHILYST